MKLAKPEGRFNMNVIETIIIKFKNVFFKSQVCERCGKDLLNEPEHGFEQLEHCGIGRYKICPKCKETLYL